MGYGHLNSTCEQWLAEKDKQIAALKLQLARKEAEIGQLKAKREKDCSSLRLLQSHIGIIPITLSMPDFNKHQREGGKWHSKPFYTLRLWIGMGSRAWAEGQCRTC